VGRDSRVRYVSNTRLDRFWGLNVSCLFGLLDQTGEVNMSPYGDKRTRRDGTEGNMTASTGSHPGLESLQSHRMKALDKLELGQ
jgi:hypothetical protein